MYVQKPKSLKNSKNKISQKTQFKKINNIPQTIKKFSIGIRVIGSLFDLFIVKRLNLAIGISDRAAFIFGDSIIMDIAFMLAKMPAIMLTARLVHRGYESTIYAILSGFHDMGKGVAMALGTVMMAAFKVDLHSRPCRTENLPMLIAVCHLLFPLLALPFVFVLIPAIRLDDVRAFERYKVDEAYGQVDHAARDAGMVEEVEAQSAPEGEQGVGGSKPGGKARLRGSRSAQ